MLIKKGIFSFIFFISFCSYGNAFSYYEGKDQVLASYEEGKLEAIYIPVNNFLKFQDLIKTQEVSKVNFEEVEFDLHSTEPYWLENYMLDENLSSFIKGQYKDNIEEIINNNMVLYAGPLGGGGGGNHLVSAEIINNNLALYATGPLGGGGGGGQLISAVMPSEEYIKVPIALLKKTGLSSDWDSEWNKDFNLENLVNKPSKQIVPLW